MTVWHYLFWIENNKITAILNSGKNYEIIKFGGNLSIEYNEEYWKNWQEYAGFLSEDLIDFCFVYDNECPQISDYLKSKECPDNECKWDKYTIQYAVNILEKGYPVQIYNENGVCIAKTGSFRDITEADILEFSAKYRNSEKEIIEEKKDCKITPFIERQLKKLKIYDGE